MLGEEAAANAPQDDSPALVYRAMTEALRGMGTKLPPMQVFCRTPAYSQFVKTAPLVVEFSDHFQPKTKTQRFAVVKMLCRLTAMRMREVAIPVSARTLAQQLSSVADYVDIQFPGYRQSNLLPIVMQQLRKAS